MEARYLLLAVIFTTYYAYQEFFENRLIFDIENINVDVNKPFKFIANLR